MGKSYEHLCTCLECGKPFDATVYDAKYCSSHCRVKVHRRKRAYEKKMLRFAEGVTEACTQWRNADDYNKHLEHLQNAINELLKARNAMYDALAWNDAKGDDFSDDE